MLSSSRKKAPNKSTWFEINAKSVYTCLDEGFDEKSVSTSRKNLLTLAGISAKIIFFFKNWPTFNFTNAVH